MKNVLTMVVLAALTIVFAAMIAEPFVDSFVQTFNRCSEAMTAR